jgi:hypothetical protein
MKKLFILFLITFNIFASDDPVGTKNITCGFDQCIPDFTPSLYLEQVEKTIIDLGKNNEDNIEINLPENQDPRSLVLVLENNSVVGRNLNVELNSKMKEKDTANFILVGDIFNELNLNLNGFDGAVGEDASAICAGRFLDGTYGDSSRNFYLARRNNDETLDMNRCDDIDVQHIQESKFSCQELGFENRDFPTVEVERVKYKQRCIGTSIRYRCLQRKVKIRCEWAGYARGYRSVSKYENYPCSNAWGGGNCKYSYEHSCWRGRDLSQTYDNIRSTAPGNVSPKWSIVYDNNRCVQPKFGGVFAYQQSEELNELRFLQAQETNTVARLCESDFPYPIAPGWKFNKVIEAYVTSPGLDPDTLQPLPGSNWEVQFTNFFTPCSSLGPFVTLNSEIQTWTAYGEVGAQCNDASIPEDVNDLIPWNASGVVQDPTFGTEKLLCNPQSCPVQNLTQEKDLVFDNIDPTAGANGTNQGDGVLLIYDYNQDNSTITARSGVAGQGGLNDLDSLSSTKYCVKISDADTKGIDSSFAQNPVVNFNIYNWEGLKINRGQPSGQVPDYSNKSIKIYKKLDSSLRYLIKNTLFE